MGSIYMITNTENGKAYIGQTIRDPKTKRIDYHLNGHGSQLVRNAVKKYGKDIFVFEILHDSIIPEFLDDLEIEAIAKYNTVAPNGYNIASGGGGSLGVKGRTPWNKGKKMSDFGIVSWNKGRKMSAEHRRKLSQAQKGVKKKPRSPEHCRKLSEVQKGKIVSEETRKKLSEALKGKPSGRKGKKHSAETRKKMSEAHKGKPSNRKGKKASPETRRRISEAGKGRIVSAETRKKHAKRWVGDKNPRANPFRDEAKQFYFSLPSGMDISEKRKCIREKFPQIINATICRWVKKWQSEIK